VKARLISLICFFIIITSVRGWSQLTLIYDAGQDPVEYGVNKLRLAFSGKGRSLQTYNSAVGQELPSIEVVSNASIPQSLSGYVNKSDFQKLAKEGFELRWINNGRTLLILSSDEIGAEYGLVEVAEYVKATGDYVGIPSKINNAGLEYRIIKFNLPWSPYRNSGATSVHFETCRDIKFWERFLDMMVENRFNTLSLWNNHPFPYMIRSTNFPKATGFSDTEMADWQKFWKQLFRMAKQRGIQTFVVNWNIVVSPEFAKAYGAKEYSDQSELVKKYTRESVTQMINEYEDLTGVGVTLADWMGNFNEKMTPEQRETWIEQTFVAGMKAANRPVKFIHRSVLAGDPLAMRKVIDGAALKQPALVEVKFNWSHGHSTPTLAITHDYHSGKLDERFWEPKPLNYNIQWMIRNEDFFILRWGQPDFVRTHIELNKHDYVNGYFIGSEGYIPAKDYSSKPSGSKNWNYAFEKQWLFYKVWGRLLYDCATKDSVFVSAFDVRYGKGKGKDLLTAYKLASNMPLRLASFYRSTWDYTLYSEGFIEAEPATPRENFDRNTPLISIDELMDHETLDPKILSINTYLEDMLNNRGVKQGMVTPLQLADSSEHDSFLALEKVALLESGAGASSGTMQSELDDLSAWAYLGLYFADKLRAGVMLKSYLKGGREDQKRQAVTLLEKCVTHWDRVIAFTKDRYVPTPHVATQNYGKEFQLFSWELLRPQVVRDIQIAKSATYKP